MTLSRTKAEAIDLAALLQGIDDGIVVLPDFQRDFKWTDKDVVALLATVLSGWPVGSLMLVEGPPNFFQVRRFKDAPHILENSAVQFTVLDGQQRLTALYYALYGRGDYRYALHLDKLGTMSVDDLEDAIQAHTVAHWSRHYLTAARQAESQTLPLSALRSAADFFSWRDEAAATLGPAERVTFVQRLDGLYRHLLSGVDRYTVPSIVVASSIAPEAIARIFERVNRTGWKLSTFDLMVAKSYSQDFNLRRVWDESQIQFPRLGVFLEGDGLPILHSIALRISKEVRQSAVLKLSGADIRERWREACAAMDKAVGFLAHECGVLRPDWIPYQNVMIVLGALAQDMDLESRRYELRRWFWLVSASGRYDVGSNTTAVRDYLILRSGSELAERYDVALVVPDAIESTPRQKQSFYRTFRCALAANGARDLVTGQRLSADVMDSGKLPDTSYLSLFSREFYDADFAGRPTALTLSTVLSLGAPGVFVRDAYSEDGLLTGWSEDVNRSQFLENVRAGATTVDAALRARLESYRGFLSRQGVKMALVEAEEDV